jgi:superfamily II DNA or RNA helicase
MYWKSKLDPQQLKCLDFVVKRPGTLIVSEVGTGKTLIALAVIEVVRPRICLIIAPLTSLDVTWAPRIARVAGYTLCRSFDAFKSACKTLGPETRIILLLHSGN